MYITSATKVPGEEVEKMRFLHEHAPVTPSKKLERLQKFMYNLVDYVRIYITDLQSACDSLDASAHLKEHSGWIEEDEDITVFRRKCL